VRIGAIGSQGGTHGHSGGKSDQLVHGLVLRGRRLSDQLPAECVLEPGRLSVITGIRLVPGDVAVYRHSLSSGHADLLHAGEELAVG
jgi:hypothetical protein